MKNIIEVKEEVKIGEVILEKGDRIEIFNEYTSLSDEFKDAWIELNDALTTLDDELDFDGDFRKLLRDVDSALHKVEKYLDRKYKGELE